MANYEAKARSNYFQVRDPASFQQFCKRWGLEPVTRQDPEHGELHGFLVKESESGGFPKDYDHDYLESLDGQISEDELDALWVKNDNSEFDLAEELSKELVPGWVALGMEIGHEKLRYLNAYIFGVNSAGEVRRMDLELDFDPVAKKLGCHSTAVAE